MHLRFRNVNMAWWGLVELVYEGDRLKGPNTIRTSSRYGDVIQITEPVLITYTHPMERVLFNAARDANPYFHVYEALWMLAGRYDVAPLVYYNKRMQEFSDDGKTLRGAYGYRWRYWMDSMASMRTDDYVTFDQLDVLVKHLQGYPNSRRAVLQMWDPEIDLDMVDTGRDLCCNLSVMFSLRRLVGMSMFGPDVEATYLDMTVTNRSNDLVWGLLGANYVHFTILQEYMAARLGARVGVYDHFTNNLHVYTSNWQPDVWLAEYGQGGKQSDKWYSNIDCMIPLVQNPEVFDQEVREFVAHNDGHNNDQNSRRWEEPWLDTVAQPMCDAWHAHKRRLPKAAKIAANAIQADDWRMAAQQWLERRTSKEVADG